MKTKHARKRKQKLLAQRLKQDLKGYIYLILTCTAIFIVLEAFTGGFTPQTIEVEQTITINIEEPRTEAKAIVETIGSMDIFPESLEYTSDKSETIRRYLRSKGESEQQINTWLRIINVESGFDEYSTAPTQIHMCDRPVSVTLWGYRQQPNRFVELKDYPNNVYWQATCADYGAVTIDNDVSQGLLHFTKWTWQDMGCMGERTSWMESIDCGIRLRNARGWNQWSSY
jgi:hypothetical protein